MVSSRGLAFGIITTLFAFEARAGPCKPVVSGSVVSSSTASADLATTTELSTASIGSATVVTSDSTSQLVAHETTTTTAETTGTETTTAKESTTIVETTTTTTDVSAAETTTSADTATTVETTTATLTESTTETSMDIPEDTTTTFMSSAETTTTSPATTTTEAAFPLVTCPSSPPQCIRTFEIQCDVIISGVQSIDALSVQECARRCIEDPTCIIFTHDGQWCYIADNDSARNNKFVLPGWTSGIRSTC